MNKFLSSVLSVLLCISLCSCGKEIERILPENSVSEPVESNIEPLEQAIEEPEIEIEAESEAGPVAAPEVSVEPESELAVSETEPAGSDIPEPFAEKASSPKDAILPEPKPEPEQAPAQVAAAQQEEPPRERLNAVMASKRLDGNLIERELLHMINTEREAAGVEVLGEEESMRFAAKIRASEAAQTFSHTRPNGTPYNTAFDEAGFSYAGKWHGENLASIKFAEGMCDEKSAALELFNGLKNSKGHYLNMVSENFYQAGIGVAISYTDGMVDIASAQLFSSL